MTGLTIKMRSWYCSGFLMLLLVTLSATGFVGLSLLKEQMTDIVHDAYLKATLTNDMINQIHDTSRAVRNILLIDNEKQNREEADNIIKADSIIRHDLDRLTTLTEDAAGQTLLAAISQTRQDYMTQRNRVVNLLDVRFKDGVIGLLIDEVDPVQKRYINAIDQLAQHQAGLMQEFETQTATIYRMSSIILLAFTIIGALLATYLINTIIRTVTVPIYQATQIVQTAASGDLTSSIGKTGQGETGLLLIALHQMHEGLTHIVMQIRSSVSALVADAKAKSQITPHDQPLNTTDTQQRHLDITSAINNLTIILKQTSDFTQQADTLATSAAEIAADGGRAVGEVIDTMQSINSAAQKIADIISVIDSIAIQTNLLALNAAVEAARAGEQGRGFAVVATEVRNLAQRSATAAKEIKVLIEDTVAKVNNGNQLVEQAGSTMHDVVDSVQRVTHIVGEMRTIHHDQNNDLETIGRLVTQLQQTNASHTLSSHSDGQTESPSQEHITRLIEAVSLFKILQNNQTNHTSGRITHRHRTNDASQT